MIFDTRRIYADRSRDIARPAPRRIPMREVRAVAQSDQGLIPILDELDLALKPDALDPAAVGAVAKKLDQWAADNEGAPAEPLVYAAALVAAEAQDINPAQHPDLKTALSVLSRVARTMADPAVPEATPQP